jgi:hypothetical protein
LVDLWISDWLIYGFPIDRFMDFRLIDLSASSIRRIGIDSIVGKSKIKNQQISKSANQQISKL